MKRVPIHAIRIAILRDGDAFAWRLLNRNEKIIGGIGVKRGVAPTRERARRDAIEAAEAFAFANRGALFPTASSRVVLLRFDPDAFVEYVGTCGVMREARTVLSHRVAVSDEQIAALRRAMAQAHPDRGAGVPLTPPPPLVLAKGL
jgi:hypothetical protein